MALKFIDISNWQAGPNVASVVGTVFTLLAILGIVVDPTTEGVGDSLKAMGYEHPKTLDEQAAGEWA